MKWNLNIEFNSDSSGIHFRVRKKLVWNKYISSVPNNIFIHLYDTRNRWNEIEISSSTRIRMYVTSRLGQNSNRWIKRNDGEISRVDSKEDFCVSTADAVSVPSFSLRNRLTSGRDYALLSKVL